MCLRSLSHASWRWDLLVIGRLRQTAAEEDLRSKVLHFSIYKNRLLQSLFWSTHLCCISNDWVWLKTLRGWGNYSLCQGHNLIYLWSKMKISLIFPSLNGCFCLWGPTDPDELQRRRQLTNLDWCCCIADFSAQVQYLLYMLWHFSPVFASTLLFFYSWPLCFGSNVKQKNVKC